MPRASDVSARLNLRKGGGVASGSFMVKRILTGIILVAVFVPILIFSHTFAFVAVIAALSAIGMLEMLKCLGFLKSPAVAVPALFLAGASPIFARYFPENYEYLTVGVGAFMIYLLYLNAYCVIMRDSVSYAGCMSVFGTCMYITGGFTSLVFLRDMRGGEYLFLLVFLGAWGTDTLAYFTGMLFGRHKLIPEVSPKKTVEGAIGGTLGCGLAFVLFGVIVSGITEVEMHLGLLFIAGIIAAVVSQFGDLTASVIKRQHDVKDYGRIFPGHGGVLDRFDSIIALASAIMIICALPFFNLIK